MHNTGRKILALARIVAIIMIVGAIIAGITTGIAIGGSLNNGAIGFFAGLVTAVLGSLSAWLLNLLLTGFGELVSNSHELLDIAKKSYATPQVIRTDLHEKVQDANAQRVFQPASTGNDAFRCPNCGATQKSDRLFCNKCGAKFK